MLKGLCRKGKEIEILKVCKPYLKGTICMSTWNRKAELAVQGESAAQRRLSEADADMNIRNWKHQLADEAQREKINFCGEWK